MNITKFPPSKGGLGKFKDSNPHRRRIYKAHLRAVLDKKSDWFLANRFLVY